MTAGEVVGTVHEAPSSGHAPGRDVVLVSLEPWDEVWRRNQHLAAGLLRRDPGLRLLVVEPPRDPLHALVGGSAPRTGRGLRPGPPVAGVGPGRLWLYEPTKLLPRRLDPGSDRRRARAVARAADRAGLSRPTLWVNDPRAADLLDVTGWPALYDVTDDWVTADRDEAERARLVRGERILLEQAVAVTVCSPALAERKGADRPVELVTNGVDADLYRRPTARPEDLPPGPTAVYVGTLHRDRLDVDLCVRTQAELDRDGGRLVLVGPVALGDEDVARLRGCGVLLLGPRPHTTVPAYLQHADVLVVPHVVDRFTDSLDPLKLYEYRAVGRPVVATPVAGFRDSGDPRVRAVPATGFPAATRRAATRPDVTVAAAGPADDLPSWQRQAAAFDRALAAVSGARTPTRG